MGYSSVMLFASILLFPLVALAAGAAYYIAAKLRLLPAGVPGILSYALIGCAGYGLLFLYSSFEMLVSAPAQFQEKHLGKSYGTPLTLRHYVQSGFQDPASEWSYALSDADAAELRRRCKAPVGSDRGDGCVVFSAMDERWLGEVLLRGNELYMMDALH